MRSADFPVRSNAEQHEAAELPQTVEHSDVAADWKVRAPVGVFSDTPGWF